MFIKFPEIDNHYQSKTVDQFLSEFPELKDTLFILKEKLHGTNIQLIFEPNKPMEVGSRNRVIPIGESFFGIRDFLYNDIHMQELMLHMQKYSDKSDSLVNLYGEFIGPGINKGVDYGDKKHLLFFNMRLDKHMLSDKGMECFFGDRGLLYLLCPTVDMVTGLRKAIEYDVVLKSCIYPIAEGDNIMEGVVIKPYYEYYINSGGHTVYLKKKNEKFIEKMKRKKRVKSQKDPISQELLDLHDEFRSYLTPMRIQGIFSKYGEMKENKQLGEYIKYMLKDAKKDFLKDNSGYMESLDKKETQYVYNHAKWIVKMLQEAL